jgi:hypothetical protein
VVGEPVVVLRDLVGVPADTKTVLLVLLAAFDRHDALLDEMAAKLCRCDAMRGYTCEVHEWAAALRSTSPL